MQFQYLQQDKEVIKIIMMYTKTFTYKTAYTFISKNVFIIIGKIHSLKLRQLDILLLKTSI